MDGGNGVEAEEGCCVNQVTAKVIGVDATQPGGGPGLTGLQEVLVGEGDGADAGVTFLRQAQRAPVEALDGDPLLHVSCLDFTQGHVDELFTRNRLLGGAGFDLGLDVELDLAGAVAVHQVKNLGEGGHLGSRGRHGGPGGRSGWQCRWG